MKLQPRGSNVVDIWWPWDDLAMTVCRHGKTWTEGADYERFGGPACEECEETL